MADFYLHLSTYRDYTDAQQTKKMYETETMEHNY